MANPNTIPWLHYQDIHNEDYQIRNQFINYCQNGNYTEALDLLSNNVLQLRGKAYIAETINKIISGLLNLENLYFNNVVIYLTELANTYAELIDNFRDLEDWVDDVQYTPYNFVRYDSKVYMCIKKPPVSTLPIDEEFWIFVDIQGEQGTPGIDVTMKYNWDPLITYMPNDLVVYENNIYVALQENTNSIPSDSQTNWGIFLIVGEGKIHIGPIAPENPVTNTIWIQTNQDPTILPNDSEIIGVFSRYSESNATWEPMYPLTLYKLVSGTGNNESSEINLVTITPNEWTNNSYTYFNDKLLTAHYFQVFPTITQENNYRVNYNNLSITTNNDNIIFTTTKVPEDNLTIIIKIQ